MTPSRPLQLGTLTIKADPDAGPSAQPDDPEWALLDAAYLDRHPWAPEESDKIGLLKDLLRDVYLSTSCDRRRRGDEVVVRVAISTNDAGRWNNSSQRVNRLRRLFPLLDKGWDGEEGRLLEDTPEDLCAGMQALYALIESPPEPHFEPGEFLGDDEAFAGLTNYENPPGVQTMMYKYQIRSVARMLQMESQPGTMVDPSYSRFAEAATGERYFVDLQRMDIRRQPFRYPLSRGGILCEQMGVGKTLMCLALVLVSRHQPTQPPVDFANNISAVTTDIALRSYPTASAAVMRGEVGISPTTDGTPSLASMCADIVACSNPAAARTGWSITPTVEKLIDERKCIYYRFPPPVRLPRGAKRVPDIAPERFVLAQTTLVVVPLLLVPQWLAEAETHLEAEALKILVIPEGGREKTPLPPMEELVRYDIVLMSLDRFRREGQRYDDETLTTELLRARWKRIILDEGNIANNTKSDAMILADALSIERRWIVSGTPTTQLKQGTESAVKSFLESEAMQRVDSGRSTPNGHATNGHSTSGTESPRRQWSKADLNDVERLGKMLKGFLASEIFQQEDFQRLVTTPLRKRAGPMYGAVERIRQIMSAIMVKHRPGVIDQEVSLPESTLTAETVHFTHWQRLTYNALTALMASNVYTSNFEDPDYFLHPRNTEAFNQVVANLHLACLWFSSTEMDLEGAIGRTESHLRKKQVTEEQRKGLEEALLHMRRAVLDSPDWSEWMQRAVPSIPYEAGMVPATILDAWSESRHTRPSLVDAASLQIMRQANTRGADVQDIVRSGWDERVKHPECEALLAVMEKAEKEWRSRPNQANAAHVPGINHHRDDTKAAADKPKAPKLVKRLGKKKNTDDVMDIDNALDEAARNAERAAESMRGARPMPGVIQTTSMSAKVNFVIRSILAAPPEDKFVIFGTYEEIAHLTDALELTDINSAYAGAKVPATQRKAALKNFASPGMRVCLLELKFAARGLTLTAANRMIFISPVWSLDVQAQAIKRIHRIGQTRPTHIDILVTQGTFEEDIVRREAAMRSNEEEKSYSRALIENPRFVYAESDDQATFPIRLVPRETTLSAVEQETYAQSLAAVAPGTTPPGESGSTTPIITPATPRILPAAADTSTKSKRVMFAGVDDDSEEDASVPVPAKKRARFADD